MMSRGRAGPAVRLATCSIRAQGPVAEPGRQLLHGGQQELFLGAEVVLDQPQGHAGLGRDLAHPGGVQPARGGRPQQRVRDLPPALLVIDPLRHPLTVSPVARQTLYDTLVS